MKCQPDADAYCPRYGLPARNWWKSGSKDLVSVHLDKRLEESFHLLVAKHLEHRRSKVEGVRNAHFVAGSRLLQSLEKALSNSFLSGCEPDTLKALVKIIFVTAIIIKLARPRLQSWRVRILYLTYSSNEASNEGRSSVIGNNNSSVFSRTMPHISESEWMCGLVWTRKKSSGL